MSIHYSLVARSNNRILTDFTEEVGNIQQMSLKILKLVKPNHKTTITYDKRYTFYYINDTKITVMCMCDNNYPTESAFEFLKEILLLFVEKFTPTQIEVAYAYSLNKDFKAILRQKMHYYNINIDLKVNANLNKIKESLLETKTQLIETTEVLQERGEQMNIIIKKADSLKVDSKNYFGNAKKMKNRVKGAELKWLSGVISFLVVGYLLASVLCGGFKLPNCFNE